MVMKEQFSILESLSIFIFFDNTQMGKCSRYLDTDGSIKLMDERFNTIYTQSYEEYGGNGERVLGFAMKPMDVSFEAEMLKDSKYKDKLRINMIGKPTDTTTPINDLIFVG